jgi:uncharacterized protein (DUF58 family)
MRLTSRGVGAVCITLVSLVCATVLDEVVLWPLVAVSLTTLVSAVVVTLVYARPVSHHIAFSAQRVHANEALTMHWEASAASPMSRTFELRTTKGVRAALYLHGFSRMHEHAMPWQSLSRGELAVTVVVEQLVDPLHLVQRTYRHLVDASVLVWPARWEITRGVLAASWDQPEFESAARGADTGIRSLREYVSGDDPRMVHWLTSARNGVLIVAERTKDTDPRVHVVLDTQLPPVLLDRAADAACSIIAMLHEQRANWSLISAHDVISATASSGLCLEAAFDELALVAPAVCDLQELLDRSRRALRVVVTTRGALDLTTSNADVLVWLHTGDVDEQPELADGVVVAWDVRTPFNEAWDAAMAQA